MGIYAGTISGPIAPYNNPPIEPQFYEPSQFVISDIARGATTTVTTLIDHDYVIGQRVRLLIPVLNRAQQLNRIEGYVVSISASNEVTLDINSSFANAFVANPLTATITNATQANPCVLTANNAFILGNYIRITGVSGMTQLNNNIYQILTNTASSITINIDSSGFSAYSSGGIATLFTTNTTQPQIIAVGDINSGQINASGPSQITTYIPGAFIDVS